jgi:hypothetical protein
MLAFPEAQVSVTDLDNSSVETSGRVSSAVGHDVQVPVNTTHCLIVTHEVTNSGSDRSQLANIGKKAKEVLGVEELEAIADRGYNGDVAQTDDVGRKAEVGKRDFAYPADEDACRRPDGEKITYR